MKSLDRTRAAVALTGAVVLSAAACSPGKNKPMQSRATVLEQPTKGDAELLFPGEVRLRNIRQLTFEGENAEAYFGPEGDELIFQATRDGFECDQIFRMDADGKNVRLVSTGQGRTTCSFISPTQPRIIYSSTHAELKTCPPPPDYSQGYVWGLQPELDIYAAGPEGQNPTPLAPHPGYDAEGVYSPQGDRILFTSTRSGDIDIFSMRPDGTDVTQLTDEEGYDGGAFFGPRGERIVYRAHHPKGERRDRGVPASCATRNLVRPSVMELFVMDADGSNKRQITNNGAANFAPYFHPGGEQIIFSSNMDDPRGRDFDLYMINVDGTGLERVTFNPSFDSFPMFSYDGSQIVFASNRNAATEGDTNVFIAEWVNQLEPPEAARLRGQAELDPQTWGGRVEALTEPEMQGRGLGTEGIELAAKYLAEQFEMAGLKPPPGQKGYRQEFVVPVATKLEEATLRVGKQEATLGEAFQPFAFSASGKVDARGRLRRLRHHRPRAWL